MAKVARVISKIPAVEPQKPGTARVICRPVKAEPSAKPIVAQQAKTIPVAALGSSQIWNSIYGHAMGQSPKNFVPPNVAHQIGGTEY